MQPIFSIFALLLISLLVAVRPVQAQQATVFGTLTDSLGAPIPYASISLQGQQKGTGTNERGNYRLQIPAATEIILEFRHSQFETQTLSLNLASGEQRELNIRLRSKTIMLDDVEIVGGNAERVRGEAGSLRLNPRDLQQVPTPFMDFNQALISGAALGIVGNNELSAAYAVRGGSFDENLVYVDNIQIYRPFLVRVGEQEGLSFINPDLVGDIEFSSGGWQAQYGDKLASALNVRYKQPTERAGSLSLGLLGGSAHLEGSNKNRKFRYLLGVRHKASRYLLNTLETDGQYLPRFTDLQAYLTFDLSSKRREPGTTTLNLLMAYARNRYELEPESRSTTFGTFGQAFRLTVLFAGAEELRYDTFQTGVKLSHLVNSRFKTDLIISGMRTSEREFTNVEGGYRLCDVNSNFGTPGFNDCVLIRGTGSEFRYIRNLLAAQIFSVESRNEWEWSNSALLAFGLRFDHESIADDLFEYTFLDSAGFAQPAELIVGQQALNNQRLSGYLQNSFRWGEHRLTAGARFNYWSLNGQWLFAPRLQYAFKPNWTRDLVFRLATGFYQQPPFFRELRDFQGVLNLDLRAQQSVHLIAGIDWNLKFWGRPFKFIAEAYHKQLWDVVAYDIDNVRVRYYATNGATARVSGLDVRLSGEFIPGTQSWFNLSILQAQENVDFDNRGFIRRPSDQRVTFSFFFEDHLPNDPSVRVNIRTLFGSGLPYGPPNSPLFRAAFGASSRYLRSDIGFSKIFELAPQKSHKRTLWVGLEVLNLFGINNNISFSWVPDFTGLQFGVPNSLSQRFFNLRTQYRF